MKKIVVGILLLFTFSALAQKTITIKEQKIEVSDFSFENDLQICPENYGKKCFLLRMIISDGKLYSYLRHVRGPLPQMQELKVACQIDITLTPTEAVIAQAKSTGHMMIPSISLDIEKGDASVSFNRLYDTIMAQTEIYADYNIESLMDNDLVQLPNLSKSFDCYGEVGMGTVTSVLSSDDERIANEIHMQSIFNQLNL